MVTARLNVTQYEKTLDTLKYIHNKDPFNRQNESASILAFLDEMHPDTREETLGGFRLNARNNLEKTVPVDHIHNGSNYAFWQNNDVAEAYERNESVTADEAE